MYNISRLISEQCIGRKSNPNSSKFFISIREIPSTYPSFPVSSKSDISILQEFTKSHILIASLHFSFKKKFKLNVVLFPALLIINVLFSLPFVEAISIIFLCNSIFCSIKL